MNWISSVFTGKKKLMKELDNTKEALKECNSKLLEKQEHINQTNAYWKKKMHESKSKKPIKKEL